MKGEGNVRERFLALVREAPRILIVGHRSPDDDDIAAILAMRFLMREAAPQAFLRLAVSGSSHNRWGYFEGSEDIHFGSDVEHFFPEADLLICLDGSQYERFTDRPEKMAAFDGPKICLDHHASPPDDFNLIFVDREATSTSEILYKIFFADRPALPPRLAEILLLGILGDTGMFDHVRPEQAEIFEIAGRLVKEGGISVQKMRSHYGGLSLREFTLLRTLMEKGRLTRAEGWPPFMAFVLPRKVLEEYTESEVSEAKNALVGFFGTIINEAPWSVALQPTGNGGVKAAFRARPGGPNVRLVAEGMGIGGGHDLAAGGLFSKKDGSPLEPEESLKLITDWLATHKPETVRA